MFEFIKNMFKKTEEAPTNVENLEMGSFIELSYKHPKDVGIINKDHLTCTRLNLDEIENRKIKGFVYSKYYDKNLRKWLLGVRACKKNGNEMIERDFLFLEYEIEKIRVLN